MRWGQTLLKWGCTRCIWPVYYNLLTHQATLKYKMGRFFFSFPVFNWKKIQLHGDLAGSEAVPLLTVPFQASSQLENSLMGCGILNLFLLMDSYLQYLWSTAEGEKQSILPGCTSGSLHFSELLSQAAGRPWHTSPHQFNWAWAGTKH